MPKGSPKRQAPKRSGYDSYNPTSQAYDYNRYRPLPKRESGSSHTQKPGIKQKPRPGQKQKQLAQPINKKPTKAPRLKAPVHNKQAKQKKAVVFEKIEGAKNQPIGVYVIIVSVFFAILGYIVAGANVTLQRNYNTQLRNQLRDIEIHNSQITNQIAQARNLEEVEYIARNNLNMSEPLPHQIVAVNIIDRRELTVDFTSPPEYELTLAETVANFFQYMFAFFTES